MSEIFQPRNCGKSLMKLVIIKQLIVELADFVMYILLNVCFSL